MLSKKIGLGTVQFGLDYGLTKKLDQSQVNDILDVCVEQNIRFLDTARSYGDSESKIGAYRTSHTEFPFQICTKLEKITQNSALNPGSLRMAVKSSVDKSLEALNSVTLDYLLLHQSDRWLLENMYFWETLNEEKKSGRIRKLGISLYSPDELKLTDPIPDIESIQIPTNIFDQRFSRALTQSGTRKYHVIGRSIFLQGMINTPSYKLPKHVEGLRPYKRLLDESCSALKLSTTSVALLHAYYSQFLDICLIGVKSAQELLDNLTLNLDDSIQRDISVSLKKLSVEDLNLIDPRYWSLP